MSEENTIPPSPIAEPVGSQSPMNGPGPVQQEAQAIPEAEVEPVPEPEPAPVRTPVGQQATLSECLHGLKKD